jgi:hypothetical protein
MGQSRRFRSGLDGRFEHVEGGNLDAIAESESVASNHDPGFYSGAAWYMDALSFSWKWRSAKRD